MTALSCYELINLQAPRGLQEVFNQGAVAYDRLARHGEIAVCPYLANTTEKYYWELGWQDEKEFFEWTNSARCNEIVKQGKDAAIMETVDNPYPNDTREADAYDHGVLLINWGN